RRALAYRLERTSSEPAYVDGRIIFRLQLEPGEAWHACALYVLTEDERVREPLSGCYAVTIGDTVSDTLEQEWQRQTTGLSSSNYEVNRAYQAAIEDVGTLRLFDEEFPP